MESKSAFRSAPLLDRALRIASQRAQTYDSLAESLGVTPEDAALYWFSINSLRRGLGHDLPPLSASARCWYDPTWHLEALLEEFQINEGLASHYGRIFYDPEGGHLELNMAANEVVYAIGLEHPDIDVARLRRVCVHACGPASRRFPRILRPGSRGSSCSARSSMGAPAPSRASAATIALLWR